MRARLGVLEDVLRRVAVGREKLSKRRRPASTRDGAFLVSKSDRLARSLALNRLLLGDVARSSDIGRRGCPWAPRLAPRPPSSPPRLVTRTDAQVRESLPPFPASYINIPGFGGARVHGALPLTTTTAGCSFCFEAVTSCTGDD